MARRNLITDVAGVRVGHAHDPRLGSGATVVLFEAPAVGAVDLRGGGPGTRETALLDPAQTVEGIDAVALSGGSAFGLDAAAGAQAWLAEQGRGFAGRSARVPIVPAAILFDLLSGGDKKWGRYPPYRELGYAAAAATERDFALGSVGAGYGATTVNLKGGIGSASAVTAERISVGALAAVNAAGSATIADGPWFWAAPFEYDGEFGGRGLPDPFPSEGLSARTKGSARASTTLLVVATDAILTKAQAKRLAVMAQTGLARAIHPVHTPLDGDVLFAVATGRIRLADPLLSLTELGAAAAHVVARAVARGVYEATALPFPKALPSWRDRFGGAGANAQPAGSLPVAKKVRPAQSKSRASSVVKDFFYDPAEQELEVIFTTGRVYLYREVPADVYAELEAASSRGSYFNENIRSDFPYCEVTPSARSRRRR